MSQTQTQIHDKAKRSKLTLNDNGKQIIVEETEWNEIEILSEYTDNVKDISKDISSLTDLILQSQDLVLQQGEDVLKIEANVESIENLTEKSVTSLAGAAREKLRVRTKKYILWGAGIGAVVGGVTGITICAVVAPDPTVALIAGGGGALTGAGAGALIGGAIGTARQQWDSKILDKTLICYTNNTQMKKENWVDPSTVKECMKCGKKLGSLWLRLKYTCNMCGEVCCWDCCNHSVVVKYHNVKEPQLERICKGCRNSTQTKKGKKTFYI